MINFNVLLVSGTGQNVGKTTLVCNVISENKQHNIIAIKVSPHFHELNVSDKIIYKTKEFILVQELNKDTNKDSSLMLKAGAKKSFYLQCIDENLPKAITYIKTILHENSNLVIESGGLGRFIKPKLFIFITNETVEEIKLKSLNLMKTANKVVVFKNNTHNFDYKNIKILENEWVILI